MEHHSNDAHGSDHDDHATEGNRQYYPKGWSVPLYGLVTIALAFALLGGFVLRASGTDKWGATEQCDENGKCCSDPNCKGDKCKDDKKCMEKCDDKKEGNAMTENKESENKTDSTAKPADKK